METQMSCLIPNELHCVTDTTDAEQDDLPCDGDGGIACEHHGKSDQLNDRTYIPDDLNLPLSEDNRNASNYEIYVQPEGVFNYAKGTIGTSGISAGIPGSELSFKKNSWCGQPDGRDPPSHSSMSHVLLRHFPTGELTSKWQLIEHETIPETSLTESIDEATDKHTACECVQGPSTGEQQAAKFEEHHLEKLKAVSTEGKIQDLLNKNTVVSKTSTSTLAKHGCRQENLLLINEYEDACIFQNTEQTYVFKKSVPSHELIAGQGEAQKCQEDSNEVTSEMKVPKMSENNKSIPTIKRTTSFPTLLSKSVTINSILENQKCFDSIEVTNQEGTSIPESSQQQKVIRII